MPSSPESESARTLRLRRRQRLLRRRADSECPAEEHLADQLGHVRERAQDFLERELLFGVNEDRWVERERLLRRALSPHADRNHRAAVFVSVRSSSIVSLGMLLALFTIGTTIVCSLIWSCTEAERVEYGLADLHSQSALEFLADPRCADLQGLVYPYISETARDMPQTGFFAFGMTITVMLMVCCAILQYGKVKRDIRPDHAEHEVIPVGAKRNFVALICGLVAPPFLGLLACYDTRRALNTHRAAVVIFFTLTIVYMFTMLSIYSYLAGIDDLPEFGGPSPQGSPRNVAAPVPASSAAGGSQEAAPRLTLPGAAAAARDGSARKDSDSGFFSDSEPDSGSASDGGEEGRGVDKSAAVGPGFAPAPSHQDQQHHHHLEHGADDSTVKPDVHLSLRLKTYIAATFTVLTTFYLPVGVMLCDDVMAEGYAADKFNIYVHAARAVCQHGAVVCIILYYGTFYYDFGHLNLSLVHVVSAGLPRRH